MNTTKGVLRFRFVMLTIALLSVVMTWGIVLYGGATHPVRACRLFETLGASWKLTALAFSVIGIALSGVSLVRRDFYGFVGLACSLSVLSGIWMHFVPVV